MFFCLDFYLLLDYQMSPVLCMGTEKQNGTPNHTLSLVFHAVRMAAMLLHFLINFEIVQ